MPPSSTYDPVKALGIRQYSLQQVEARGGRARL